MPLYVTNGKLQLGEPGKLAAQRACCCDEEGDNPEDCVCPDFCLYQAAVVEPVQFGPWPPLPCEGPGSVFDGQTFEQPISTAGCAGEVESLPFQSRRTARVLGLGFYDATIQACPGRGAGLDEQSVYWDGEKNTWVFASALFTVACCDSAQGGTPPTLWLYSDIFFSVTVGLLEKRRGEGGDIYYAQKRIRKISAQALEANCSKVGGRACAGDSSLIRAKWFTAPGEVVVTFDTPGAGGWQTVLDEYFGDQSLIQPCWDALVENFSATFRISQRSSCQSVACNCGVDLFTMKGIFDGKEFTLGAEYEYYEADGDIEYIWGHTESSNIYYFYYEKWLGPGKQILYESKKATLFCDDDEVDSVPRWYVVFEMKCRTYDGFFALIEETTKTEIGYFNCGIGEFCGGLSGKQPVPLGSPVEIEEAPGSPETQNGLNPCTPPARPSLTLSCQ